MLGVYLAYFELRRFMFTKYKKQLLIAVYNMAVTLIMIFDIVLL